MGFIGDMFGGGDKEESPTQTPASNNGGRSWFDSWRSLQGAGGGGGADSYLNNFVYQPNQSTPQINNGSSFSTLAQGLVASPYGTVSGYTPLNYGNTFQPRASLYDLYRGGF